MPNSKEHMWFHVYELSQRDKSKETLAVDLGRNGLLLIKVVGFLLCDKSTKIDCVGRNKVYVWETIESYI